MKRIFFALIVFFIANKSKAEEFSLLETKIISPLSVDTATYPIANFQATDWAFYINKPINTLLADLDNLFPGYILGQVYANERLRMASRINIYYGEGRGLILHVRHFQHMEPYSQNGGPWDVSLFRQENISRIELWDNTVCVYNSNP